MGSGGENATFARTGVRRAAAAWLLRSILPSTPFGLQAAEAQEPAAPPKDVQAERLERLEKRNEELERRLSVIEGRGVVEGRGPASPQDARDSEDPGDASEDDETGMGIHRGNLRIAFQLFGDVGFMYNSRPEDEGNTAFAFGSMDLFTTAQMGDHFRVLSETVWEGEGDEIEVEQERLYASYQWSDFLYAKAGVEHLFVTRWNRLYHHGRWLETSIERPHLTRFEDDEGFMPTHFAGVEVGGLWRSPAGLVEYAGVISNGRGPTPEDRQRLHDINDAKAVGGWLGFQPARVAGLNVGASVYFDEIPGDDSIPGREHHIRELIASGSAIYRRRNFHLVGEAVWLQNREAFSNRGHEHVSAYLQLAYQLGLVTPYTRIDFSDMENGDPYFMAAGTDVDRWEQIFGARYDFIDQAALKLELGFGRVEDSATEDREWIFNLRSQLAWYF